jgi:hypothetical protein
VSPSLLFEIEPVENNAFRLAWHGECPLTIEDLDKNHKGSPKLDAAEKYLLDNLAGGPKEVNWLIENAKGICSKRTMDEVKRNLELKTIRKGRGKDHVVYWSL